MMHTQSTAALRRALRPPRAGSADRDRLAMREALRRTLDEHVDRCDSLETAGYASAEDFTGELNGLLASSREQLTPNVLTALLGDHAGRGGRLGRLLGVV